MNENIGAKGGTNDRKRFFRLIKSRKKKLTQEELKNLEKKVKKHQLLSAIIIIPLAALGTVVKTLTKKEKVPTKKQEVIKEQKLTKVEVQPKEDIIYTKEDQDKLSNELSKIKTKKIIEIYEDKLKELRYKLRTSYYESSIIEDAKNLENHPSEENLKKINKLIEKLDNYKENIPINTSYLVEENYIKELVDEDIKNINIKQKVNLDNTKSDLLSSIDFKVEEIIKLEKGIREKVEQNKVWKNIDEEKLENLKEEKQDIEKHNNDLIKFQNEQDKLNKVITEKISKEVNIFEKERIQLSGMSIGSSIAVNNVRHNMRPTGVRSTRKVFNFITTYLYYFSMINSIKPIKRRYKKIEVKSYTKDVESSIEQIELVLKDINKTNNKLDKTIKNFMKKYERYSNTKEYKSILENLKQMQQALLEKEYEIQRLKKEQEKKYQESLEQDKVYKL